MTQYIKLSGFGVFALLLGACEVDETSTASGANEEALSSDEAGAQDGFRGRGRRGPPPQAVEACANLDDGASCSFDGRRGNVDGTCMNHPRTDGLVCAPEGRFGKGRFGKGHGRGHRGPPPQSIEACEDLDIGATCSFDGFRGEMSGTCLEHPRLGGVACAPEGRFGHGHRHGSSDN